MYLQIIAIALFFSGYLPEPTPDHAFYIAVIEITHATHSEEAELTVKVFTDDMQDALRNALQKKENVEAQRLCTEYEEDVSAYFAAHMILHINGNPIPVLLTSCEEIGDTHQLKFTMNCPDKWDELRITADFLMELFPTQSQMVHITHNGDTVTARLTAKHQSHTVTFIR